MKHENLILMYLPNSNLGLGQLKIIKSNKPWLIIIKSQSSFSKSFGNREGIIRKLRWLYNFPSSRCGYCGLNC